MSEFFLELFSEEIPANLQSSARKELKDIFIKFYLKKLMKRVSFFFFNKPSEKISVFKLFRDNIESQANKIPWKKIYEMGRL